MKATGIIRRIDDLGRLIVPKEIRRTLSIHEGDPFEIFCEKDTTIFRKYNPSADYRETLSRLRKNIRDDDYLKDRPAILQKIEELDALLLHEMKTI